MTKKTVMGFAVRMEPVFFALGQVAGMAAAQALDEDVPVQDVDYGRLCGSLRREGQVLSVGQGRVHGITCR